MTIDEAMHRIRSGLKALGFPISGSDEFPEDIEVDVHGARFRCYVGQWESGPSAMISMERISKSEISAGQPIGTGISVAVPQRTACPALDLAVDPVPDDIDRLKADSSALRGFIAEARRMLADEYYSGDHPMELVRDVAAYGKTPPVE